MSTITIMEIGGWLRSLGLEQYEAVFRANAVDADLLRDLTDQDLRKLGVLLGHRNQLLRGIAALNGALLATAAAGTSPEHQEGEAYSVSPSPPPSDMCSKRRPTEMIGVRSLLSPERTTSWLTASDEFDGDDIQAADAGEASEADEYRDDHASPRWRYRLVMAIVVIALAGLGGVGALAYRAVSVGAVLAAFPPFIKDTPNENVSNDGNYRPSDLSHTFLASAGSTSEEFASRFPADNQEPKKTSRRSPNPSVSPPSALEVAVAPIVTALVGPPPYIAPTALAATSLPPNVAVPVPAPSSSTLKKNETAISRSGGPAQTDTAAATAKAPTPIPSAAAATPPAGSPLSLAPDAHDHSAGSSPRRSRTPAGTEIDGKARSGGGYEVAVASERNAADADAVFRSLQVKFPNQLGGREPIVRRTVLGPEGTYYRASIGPFTSMKAAARVCNSLKAAGESCLVEKN